MSNHLLGRWSSLAVFAVGVAYMVVLAIGFATRGLSAPIVDPLLAVMEVLTLLSAPLLLIMMVAIQGRAPRDRKAAGVVAIAFMILMTGTTSAVHFVELTALRQRGTAGLVWPSTAYALELLAWDVFLGVSLAFAAFTFERAGRERRVRRGLLVCGALCIVGVVGPAIGNMRLQIVGILGYAAVLPVVCLMLANLFRTDVAAVRDSAAR